MEDLEIVYAALVWNALGVFCEPDDDGLIALFPFATFFSFSDRSSFYCRAKRCVDLIGSSISSRYHPYIWQQFHRCKCLKIFVWKEEEAMPQELLCFALYEWLVNKRWYWFSKKYISFYGLLITVHTRGRWSRNKVEPGNLVTGRVLRWTEKGRT